MGAANDLLQWGDKEELQSVEFLKHYTLMSETETVITPVSQRESPGTEVFTLYGGLSHLSPDLYHSALSAPSCGMATWSCRRCGSYWDHSKQRTECSCSVLSTAMFFAVIRRLLEAGFRDLNNSMMPSIELRP